MMHGRRLFFLCCADKILLRPVLDYFTEAGLGSEPPPPTIRVGFFKYFTAAPAKLHARARFFRFARKFNGDLCMAAPYVQVRTKRRLRCPDQPDPRPTLTLTLTPTLTPTRPFGGLEVCSRGRQGQYRVYVQI